MQFAGDYDPTPVAALVGYAQHIHCGLAASDMNIGGDSDHTVTGWAYIEDWGDGLSGGGIWCIGSSAGLTAGPPAPAYQNSLRTSSATDDYMVVNHWNTVNDYTEETSSLATWYHWAVTYTASTNVSRLYRDGVEEESHTLTSNLDLLDGEPMSLGEFDYHLFPAPAGEHYYNYFEGRIADVRVYSRVLTENEILTMYTSKGKDGILLNLEARWPLYIPRDSEPQDVLRNPTDFSATADDWSTHSAGLDSQTPTLPTHNENDLLVAVVAISGETGETSKTCATPSGWQEELEVLFTTDYGGDNTPMGTSSISPPSLYVFSIIAGASESNPTFDLGGTQTTGIISIIYAYRNELNVEQGSAGEFTDFLLIGDAANTSIECPSVTINTNADAGSTFVCLRICVADGTDATATTPTAKGSQYRGAREETETGSNGVGLAVNEELCSGNTTRARSFDALANAQELCGVTCCFRCRPSIPEVSGSAYHPHLANPQGNGDDQTNLPVWVETPLRGQ
jgi:hypothetical protein